MAQKVLVQLVDDLDGVAAGEVATVVFGLDGVDYEIDLNSENADRLRGLLAQYVDAGRRTGGRLRRGARPRGEGADPGEAGLVRAWARENGYELSDRGRIPNEVTEAYRAARDAEQKPKAKAGRAAGKRRS